MKKLRITFASALFIASGTLIALATSTAPVGGPTPNEYAQVQSTSLDTANSVDVIVQKKIAASTYSPTPFSNFGANVTLNVKATTGNVYSISCYNANAASRYFQLHNTATTPSGGATPVFSFLVPAGGQIVIGTDFFTNEGVNFSTGIAFAFSTTQNTYTAGAAADQTTFINFK